MKYKRDEEDLSWGEIPDGLEGLQVNRPLDILAGGALAELEARLTAIDRRTSAAAMAIKQKKRMDAWMRMDERARWLHKLRRRRFGPPLINRILRALAPGEPTPPADVMKILHAWQVPAWATTRKDIIQTLLENATAVEERFNVRMNAMQHQACRLLLLAQATVHLNVVATIEAGMGYCRMAAQRQRTLAFAVAPRACPQRSYIRPANQKAAVAHKAAVAFIKAIQLEMTFTA